MTQFLTCLTLIIRYSAHGAHHHVSTHFALGQHAVERLNATNLNRNEILINQLSSQQNAPSQQQIAQATFAVPTVYQQQKAPIQVPQIDNKLPLITNPSAYIQNTPSQDNHQRQHIIYPIPGVIYNQHVPQYENQGKHQTPMIYQQHQQIPVIYQYAQQLMPQINYYNQRQPQNVIYHQQPIITSAQPQQRLLLQPVQSATESNNGNIEHQVSNLKENSQLDEILLQRGDIGGTENSLQTQSESAKNIATDNRKLIKFETDIDTNIETNSPETHFQSPIVVGDNQQQIETKSEKNQTVIVQQKFNQPQLFESYQPPQKQFNLQILAETHKQQNVQDGGQYLKEIAPKITNGHTNNNNFQYLVEDNDQDLLDSTPSPRQEAPSRYFLKNFKSFRTYEKSTTSQTISTTTATSTIEASSDNCCRRNQNSKCCKIRNEENLLEITQRPLSIKVLAPFQAGIAITNEKLENCLDGHEDKIIVEIHKSVNVKDIFIQEPPKRVPIFGERIIVSTPPNRVAAQPIFVKKPQQANIIHKQVIVEQPIVNEVHIQSPPQTQLANQHVIQTIENIVKEPYEIVKEKSVDRPVYIQSPPETKVARQHVIQTVEKPIYIEKIVKEPYEVVKEKIVDRPVYIQSPPETKVVHKKVFIEKFVDRPYPLVQTVEKPVYIEKVVYQNTKPDFHVIAKTIPHKHKLFDYDGLFGFLNKKKEVQHYFVPAGPQHQLKQLNQHQLMASSYAEPVRDSTFYDYVRFATTHLNPIKPVYGVPALSTPLTPVNQGNSCLDPYSGMSKYYALSFLIYLYMQMIYMFILDMWRILGTNQTNKSFF